MNFEYLWTRWRGVDWFFLFRQLVAGVGGEDRQNGRLVDENAPMGFVDK